MLIDAVGTANESGNATKVYKKMNTLSVMLNGNKT